MDQTGCRQPGNHEDGPRAAPTGPQTMVDGPLSAANFPPVSGEIKGDFPEPSPEVAPSQRLQF